MAQKFIFVNTDGDYQESPGAYEQSDFINQSNGAADAGKPVVLDADGLLDPSFINVSEIDHGDLEGLGDDDHPQYILADGTRPFTGNQSMGGNVLTNLGAPVDPGDATNKEYVDALATGLRPHGDVRVATTGNIDLSIAPADIDGMALSSGDRVLVKDQTDATENGIYVYNGGGSAMTRAEDFDNSAQGEIWNGSFIPLVLDGVSNMDTSWIVTSQGTGADNLHIIGTDAIQFSIFDTPTQLNAGNGIDITSNVVSVDLLDADSGLAFLGATGDELGIEWATNFTIDGADSLAVKASDLSSTSNGLGASIIGVEDSAGNFVANDLESVLEELANSSSNDYIIYTAGTAISKGDMVYISADDTVSVMPVNASHVAIGIANNDATVGNDVQVMKDDTVITGVLTGATAGTKYYWNGTSHQTAMPSGVGRYVWLSGTAKNGTDIQVETRFIKRNSV